MRRVLLVKTSSLGDVVHNLPVVSDLRRMLPGVEIDWVVEEAFATIPRLHGGVSTVIRAAIRRWRRTIFRRATHDEINVFLRQLRNTKYDAVIDTQGLFKSALIARAARGVRHGLDWKSSREPLGLFYDHTYSIPWRQHAVRRNRALAAQALGYVTETSVDYGAAAPVRTFDWLPSKSYAVLLHASSADRKRWPDDRWIALGNHLQTHGYSCVLPWGSDTEHARSLALAAKIIGATVSPQLDLEHMAALLASAGAVIGVDTGLTHLAAALGARTIGIYGATDPAATGIYGCARAVNLGNIGIFPGVDEVTRALEQLCA